MRKTICDGCNVREPFEHRCHGSYNVQVRGERVAGPCECEECTPIEPTHRVGCICEVCSAAYEHDAWDPRMGPK